MVKRIILGLVIGALPVSLMIHAPYNSAKPKLNLENSDTSSGDANPLETLTRSELVKLSEALDLSSVNTSVDMGDNYKMFDVNNEDFQKVFLTSSYTIPAESNSIIGDSASSIAASYEDSFGFGGGINISVPVGNVGFDVSTNFDTSVKSSFQSVNEEYFEYWQVTKTMKIAQIDWKATNVEGFLTTEFKNTLNAVNTVDTAKALLKKYGTHIFDNYYFGGSLAISRYICSSTSIAEDLSSDSFEFNLTADITSAIKSNVDGNQSTQLTNTTNVSTTQTRTKVIAKGGNNLNGLTPEELFTFKQEYASQYETGFVYLAWLESIGRCESLRIVNATRPVAIWDVLKNTSLCDDTKYNLFKQAFDILCFENYAKNCFKLDIAPGYIETISYSTNDYQISFDLNSSSIKLPQNSVAQLSFGDAVGDCFGGNNISLSVLSGDSYCTLNGNTLTIKDGTIGKRIVLELKVFDYVMFTLNVEVSRGAFEKGYGSKNQPYLISTSSEWTQLINNKDNYSKLYFELINDIDLGGKMFSPGGSASKSIFYGVINGNYHTISNFTVVSKGEWNNIGLIGNNCGSIYNLFIDGAKVINSGINTADNKGMINAGILVGRNSGTIHQVAVKNSSIRIAASLENECMLNVGGLIGFNDKHSSINCCSVDKSNVYGIAYDSKGEVNVGGLTGRALNCTIANSFVSNTSINADAYYNNYGSDGDYYIETSNKTLYNKTNGVWSILPDFIYSSGKPDNNKKGKYYYDSQNKELYSNLDNKGWKKVEASVLTGTKPPKDDAKQLCAYSIGGLLGKAEMNSKVSFVVLFSLSFNQRSGQFGNVAGSTDRTVSFENVYYESVSTNAIGGKPTDGCNGVRVLTLAEINNSEWNELWTSDSYNHPILRWEVQ